jgi:predicted nuclease with TOPRIM domain
LLEATKGKEAQMAALWLKLEARAAEVTDLQQRNKKLQEDHVKSAQEKGELESALTRLQAKLQSVQEEKEQLQVGSASLYLHLDHILALSSLCMSCCSKSFCKQTIPEKSKWLLLFF